MTDFDDVLTNETAWQAGLAPLLAALADNTRGQLDLWPVDDFLAAKTYVACPRRGTHRTLTECWMCFGDVAWGYATAEQVLTSDQP